MIIRKLTAFLRGRESGGTRIRRTVTVLVFGTELSKTPASLLCGLVALAVRHTSAGIGIGGRVVVPSEKDEWGLKERRFRFFCSPLDSRLHQRGPVKGRDGCSVSICRADAGFYLKKVWDWRGNANACEEMWL